MPTDTNSDQVTVSYDSWYDNPLSGFPDPKPVEKVTVQLRSLSPLLRREDEALKRTRDGLDVFSDEDSDDDFEEESDEEEYAVPPKRQATLSFTSFVTMAKLMRNQFGLTAEQNAIINKVASM
jgi:hypothetical protein